MAHEQEKVAVLLRGPQCAGKTTVGQILGGKRPISLDDGNYDQLRTMDGVLIIELGYGEGDGQPAGPTRNPSGWQHVLKEERRPLCAFYLTVDRSERESRAKEEDAKARNVSSLTLDASDKIHRRSEVQGFAEAAGIHETRIDTTGKSKTQVADEIRAMVTMAHPAVRWPSTH